MHGKPTTPTICPQCETTFFVFPGKANKGVCCSRRCGFLWNRKSIPARFWALVDKTGPCWLWTGTKHNGYGKFEAVCGQQCWAHRLAWELTNGLIPDGLFVCHDCPDGDNPSCCNPSHMFLGTHRDNVADAVEKQQHRRGEAHMSAILDEAKVRAMRDQYEAGGVSVKRLALENGVCYTAAYRAISRETWKHVG